jgi:Glycosyl transferases group 1
LAKNERGDGMNQSWVIAKGIAATQHYRMGYARVLASMGADVTIWDPQVRPAADLFVEQSFSHLLLGTWELTPSVVRNVIDKGTKLFLWAPNKGLGDKDVDLNNPLDTVQIATQTEVDLVEKLERAGAVREVFSYYHHKHLDYTHTTWQEMGISTIGLPLAADLFMYPLTKPDPNIASDFAFVGGRWVQKAACLDPYILPLCHPSMGLSGKIYGSGHWPVPNHLGWISDELVPKLFASSKVCPCVYEPIATLHKEDLSERVYKVVSSGGFPVSQDVPALRDMWTKDEVVSVPLESFHETVWHFCKYPEERLPFMKRAIKRSYAEHNYHRRMRRVFEFWGETKNVLECDASYDKLVKRIKLEGSKFSPELANEIECAD